MSGALLLAGATGALAGWAYGGYPLWLWWRARRRPAPPPPGDPAAWPTITVVLPVHNEGPRMGALLAQVLAADYPADRRQVLVVSDASTDRTDAIVRQHARRGVELLRLPRRMGKSAAEDAARGHVRGAIVINIDAGVDIPPHALKALVRAFGDPAVGVASGRDVSVGAAGDGTAGEAGYVGYEMTVRALETMVDGLVGASGCFFAARAGLYRESVPARLSRDFAMALVAHERGYRTVAVADAVCGVPRSGSLRREYRRKVRTMARGMTTLWYWRHLLHPRRHGGFAVALWSHKVCRWLVPWAAAAAAFAFLPLLASPPLAILALGTAAIGIAGWRRDGRVPGRPLRALAYLLTGFVATLHATCRAAAGRSDGVWEPTRRQASADA